MEAEFRKRGGECPQLIDLISIDDWLKRDAGGGGGKSFGASEEKKLELTLAPPGEGWPVAEEELEKPPSSLSQSCFSKFPKSFDKMTFVAAQMAFLDTAEPKAEGFKVIAGLGKESSLEANGRMEQCHVRRVHPSSQNGPLVKGSTQIRATSAPAVGWPPIRSFRKNIAITSTKQSNEFKDGASQGNGLKGNTSKKGFFVKINMDGIPIGRKVDLNAYDNYQKLSSIVAELFSGLLAAQRDPTASDSGTSEDRMAFTGLLDGSGEYTLVYEDNEGDRMMVGDVPWEMFVSTAKRLRVLKNSELSAPSQLGAINAQQKESSRVLN